MFITSWMNEPWPSVLSFNGQWCMEMWIGYMWVLNLAKYRLLMKCESTCVNEIWI